MIDFKVESIGSMKIMDINTNEEYDFGETKELTHEFEISAYKEPPIRTIANTKFNCDVESNQERFDKLWNIAVNNGKAIEGWMDIPCIRQRRTHKKKRINKKWLKRYGYEQYTKKVFAKKITVAPEDYPKDYFKGVVNFEMEFDPKEAKKFYHKDVVRAQRFKG